MNTFVIINRRKQSRSRLLNLVAVNDGWESSNLMMMTMNSGRKLHKRPLSLQPSFSKKTEKQKRRDYQLKHLLSSFNNASHSTRPRRDERVRAYSCWLKSKRNEIYSRRIIHKSQYQKSAVRDVNFRFPSGKVQSKAPSRNRFFLSLEFKVSRLPQKAGKFIGPTS